MKSLSHVLTANVPPQFEACQLPSHTSVLPCLPACLSADSKARHVLQPREQRLQPGWKNTAYIVFFAPPPPTSLAFSTLNWDYTLVSRPFAMRIDRERETERETDRESLSKRVFSSFPIFLELYLWLTLSIGSVVVEQLICGLMIWNWYGKKGKIDCGESHMDDIRQGCYCNRIKSIERDII